MSDFKIMIGDCRESMRTLEAGGVNCCVTSPPYFGLRDYGHAGQIGLEETPEAYVAEMVDVFREVRRVLRDDGTVWLNLGDSYAATTKGSSGKGEKQVRNAETLLSDRRWRVPYGLKPKDLIGIPWRVAFALQADGWYLRQDIIWAKPNPMPESVTDRCTKAHEYIFLLSKSARYYYDNESVKENSTGSTKGMGTSFRRAGSKRGASLCPNSPMPTHRQDRNPVCYDGPTRNRRSVWTVATRPFKGAHFATFPPDLITPCVLAGCPVGGTVLDPFSGAGTTGLVACTNGRSYIGCELNTEYAAMSESRIQAEANRQAEYLF
jgi:DNA modification methylase